jgi:hypothetical protein
VKGIDTMNTTTTSRVRAFPSTLAAEASAALPALTDSLRKWRDWEDQRESFPGEHWIVLGAGVAALVAAARSDHNPTRVLGAALGLALLARAASGRDGISKALPYLPEMPSKPWF